MESSYPKQECSARKEIIGHNKKPTGIKKKERKRQKQKLYIISYRGKKE